MPVYWISNNTNYELRDEKLLKEILKNDKFYVLSKEGNIIKSKNYLKEYINYFIFSVEININNFINEQKKINDELNFLEIDKDSNSLYSQSKNLLSIIDENHKKNLIFVEAYLSMYNYLTKVKEFKSKNKKLIINQFHQQISKIDYVHKNWLSSFKKLKDIEIPEYWVYDTKYIKLDDFFDEKTLVTYSNKSKLNLEILKDKIQNLKEQEIKEIDDEFDFYESFIDKLYISNPSKNKKLENIKIQLENLTDSEDSQWTQIYDNLKNFKNNESLKYELPIENFFVKIVNYEKETQIQNKYEFIKALLKKCEKESYFLNIFFDFENNFNELVNELNRRLKNNNIIYSLFKKINEFIKKEKNQRINFLNEYAKKLPNNFFPFLKNYLKDFNLNNLNNIIEEDIPYKLEELDNDSLMKEINLLIIDN